MLYQPTNIMPSSFAGVGGDLVNDGDDLVVSWQINGTSAMTAYRIVIYNNDANSTQLYSTGKVTLSTPVYGVDGMGNVERYSVTIDYATITSAGIVVGNSDGYKLKITQWWDTNSYVEQSSYAWFIIYSEPTVSISTSYLSSYDATISGTWSQGEDVGMDWVRWKITAWNYSGGTTIGDVLIDTGVIHTQSLEFDPEHYGWANGNYYLVELDYQLQNGYTGTVTKILVAAWAEYPQVYNTPTVEHTDVCADLLLRYPIPVYLPLTSQSGSLSIGGSSDTGYYLSMATSSTKAVWSGVVLTEWIASGYPVWSTIPQETCYASFSGNITINGGTYSDMHLRFTIDPSAGTVTWGVYTDSGILAGSDTFDLGEDLTGKIVTIMMLEDGFYIYWREVGSLSVNDEEVLPWSTLYINGTEITENLEININGADYEFSDTVGTYSFVSENESGKVNRVALIPDNVAVTLYGNQNCYYIGLLNSTCADTLITELMTADVTQPDSDANWLFLSSFYQGYSWIGSIVNTSMGTGTLQSIIVYRIKENAYIMEKCVELTDVGTLAMHSANMGRLIDYGVVSGETYSYIVYEEYIKSSTTYIAKYTATASITPCYWDWILVTAAEQDDGTYHMTGTYRFALNTTTGNQSNNNTPSIMQNFTKYPTRQGVTANYRSGSLSAYIGSVDTTNNVYVDTAAQAQAIMDLSTSSDAKFLRSRKGEMWKVETSAATALKLGDKYKEQPYTATLNWVEIGSADTAVVISLPTDDEWPL